ncbi:MAG: peptidase domain-containing ABC transporter [Bacteroides sp.]|nr:peptidase domain-containing ABC transporter [Bacteroides sp.]
MKFVKQKDAMQCGVACLSMICSFYGKNYSQRSLSELCKPTVEGVSLLGIKRAAEYLGLTPDCYKMTLSELLNSRMPCVLHWNQNHFVVLYKVSSRKKGLFYIADPAKGKIKCTSKDLMIHWLSVQREGQEKGIVMFFSPSERFGIVPDSNIDRRSIKFLMKYLKEYRKHLVLIVTGLITGCVLQLIIPFLTQLIVDIGIGNKDIRFIWLILTGELFIVFGRTATDFIRRWLQLHVSIRINLSLLRDFLVKLLKLPMSFFDTKFTGDILQRMADHGKVQSFLTDQVLNVSFSLLSLIILGIVLLLYNWVIFSVFMCGSMIYGCWLALFIKRRKILNNESFSISAKNHNITYQFITSMQEIKLQNCEQRRREEWEKIQADMFDVNMKSLKVNQIQEAGSVLINEIKNILITVLAASSVIEGEMSFGSMLAIQYIIGQLNSPVSQLMHFVYAVQDVNISLERINEIHDTEEEEHRNKLVTRYNGPKDIILNEIDFKYDKNNPTKIIDRVSIMIPSGKVTAIVGASGSGKTTLLKLILGYYSVDSGCVRIAGRNIEDYSIKWLRNHCGAVMQDGVIFSESIARNIAVDDGKIDIKKLERAANIANIHEFIMSLPLRYNTIIGRDGVGLSQGQKQRILIARAVYKEPDFILFDEATNSLDANNERAIVENLIDFYHGRTVIVVAHRLSTVKNADQIIVLEKGRVVETGSHNDLIKMQGLYHKLVKNQLELGG